jgi:hypothetical protein
MLPVDVRLMDVAEVLGRLSGADRWHALPTTAPEMASIQVYGDLVDGESIHYCTFHFEAKDDDGKPCRLLLPTSTDFWIAAGVGLADFFGGKVDFDDCDDVDADHVATMPRLGNSPDDGEPYHAFREEVTAVRPVAVPIREVD